MASALEAPAPGSFSYVKGAAADGARRLQNGILKYARGLVKGEAAQVDAALQLDFQAILDGGAIYLPEFHCEAADLATLQALARDLEQSADGLINWCVEWRPSPRALPARDPRALTRPPPTAGNAKPGPSTSSTRT